MNDPNNMTDEQLIDEIAEQIVQNIIINNVWTTEDWIKDTLIRGIDFVPLVEMDREQLLHEYRDVVLGNRRTDHDAHNE